MEPSAGFGLWIFGFILLYNGFFVFIASLLMTIVAKIFLIKYLKNKVIASIVLAILSTILLIYIAPNLPWLHTSFAIFGQGNFIFIPLFPFSLLGTIIPLFLKLVKR